MLRLLFGSLLSARLCFGAVELLDENGFLKLRNEHVSLQFGKNDKGLARAQIDVLHLSALTEPTANLLEKGMAYWDMNTGYGGYCSVSGAYVGHRVIQQTPDLVEIGFVNKDATCGLMTEIYYVLRSGDLGFYSHAVLRRDRSVNETVSPGQSRIVMRLDPSLFTVAAVPKDEGERGWRTGEFPPPSKCGVANQVGPKEVLHVGPGSAPEDFYTKYSWSVKMDRDHAHGTVGHRDGQWVGAFVISPSNEYVNGGPNHPELAVHQTDTTPCLLKMLSGGHYDYPEQPAPKEGWEKLYGPFFVRLDVQSSMEELLSAADAMVPEEQAQWPYEWMVHKLYKKASSRGSVTGTVRPSFAPEGGLQGFAILGAPMDVVGEAPLFGQGLDFIFWADLQPDGTFQIPKVRTGSYSLWLHLPGILPQDLLVIERLQVSATVALDVGELVVESPRLASQVLWQVGKADDSVAEFLSGKAAEEHGLFLWFRHGSDYGEALDFAVGVDDPATSWPYMQPFFNDSAASEWRLHFDRPAAASRLVFTVGVQSANLLGHVSNPSLQVLLNDQPLTNATLSSFKTHVYIRCGTTSGAAPPQHLVAELDSEAAAALPAKNVLTLRLSGQGATGACGNYPGSTAAVRCPNLAVLYDFIRLEIDPVEQLQV